MRLVSTLARVSLAAVSLIATSAFAVVPTASAEPEQEEQLLNYEWKYDIGSQIMALKQGGVLHRAPSSYFNAPDIPQEARDAEARGKALFGPGTPIFVHGFDGTPLNLCTLGIVGYDAKGRGIGITAAHCGEFGQKVSSADAQSIAPTGTIVGGNKSRDYSVIVFDTKKAELSRTYDGVTVNSLSGKANDGEQICKKGVGTGMTCGLNLITSESVSFSHVCATRGDSGAPILRGDQLVGFMSGGMDIAPGFDTSCRTPLQGFVHSPAIVTTSEQVMADLNEHEEYPGYGLRLP